jgi:transcriptional regulator with XRE-family HTH domain
MVVIGQRLREIRKAKKLTQFDIAHATGLAQPLISRIERGEGLPSIDTLEKWARGLDVQVYQLLYEGEGRPVPLKLSRDDDNLWGSSGREAKELNRLRRYLAKMTENDRRALLLAAAQIAQRSSTK